MFIISESWKTLTVHENVNRLEILPGTWPLSVMPRRGFFPHWDYSEALPQNLQASRCAASRRRCTFLRATLLKTWTSGKDRAWAASSWPTWCCIELCRWGLNSQEEQGQIMRETNLRFLLDRPKTETEPHVNAHKVCLSGIPLNMWNKFQELHKKHFKHETLTSSLGSGSGVERNSPEKINRRMKGHLVRNNL